MTRPHFLIPFICLMLFFSSQAVATNGNLLQQGQEFFQRGAFVQAIQRWKAALNQPGQGPYQRIDTLIRLAAAYQALGDYTSAYTLLYQQALPLADRSGIPEQRVLIHSYLGDILLAMRKPDAAKKYLDDSLSLARTLDAPLVLAHLLNNLGNVWLVQQTYADHDRFVRQAYSEALKAYQEAAKLAQRGGDTSLQIKALSNQIQAHLKVNEKLAELMARLDVRYQGALKSFRKQVQENVTQSVQTLETARRLVSRLPESYDKGFHLLGLGQLALRLHKQIPKIPAKPKIPANSPLPNGGTAQRSRFSNTGMQQLITAYQLLNEALQLAKRQQDNYLMAYAKGLLGEVYERKQRYREALQLTRQAIFFAQDDPSLLYLWEWQLGRILQAQSATVCVPATKSDCAEQHLAAAKKAYQQASQHLRAIQTELFVGQRNSQEVFYERIRPVYFGLADILLQQAAAATSPELKAELLEKAISSVEMLKESELQEYFQNDCISNQSEEQKLDQILDKKTAILYPILLPNRTELLLRRPDGIYQEVVPVGADMLGRTVHQFRANLQTRHKNKFIIQARKLYDWLIAPLSAVLTAQDIDTLVIVPDGPLRTVPLAALFNKRQKRFLIEDFAIATTPGFNLTDPRPLSRQNISVLLNGLSVKVAHAKKFNALTNVTEEIQNIKPLFDNSKVLLNSQFTLEGVGEALQKRPYSIVHVASHGQFQRDPKDTFLLAYDDKLTMDILEDYMKFNELNYSVELLTLSACQTAVGDERAALGLAGVAIKAGAKSALASLWFVVDEATSKLMSEFYQQLVNNPDFSKAQALQAAQKKLIAQKKFRHPAYWSPFLLIGNWL
jgi:CHAT domain-containing protein